MANEINPTGGQVPQNTNGGGKVIDEANYQIHAPREKGPTAIGRGGDPLFRGITATKAQLEELNNETATVQNWVNREDCNDVARNCLKEGDLKDIYYEIFPIRINLISIRPYEISTIYPIFYRNYFTYLFHFTRFSTTNHLFFK